MIYNPNRHTPLPNGESKNNSDKPISIMDLFTDEEEFPENKADRIIPPNTSWDNVVDEYLKAYLFYTEPFYAIVMQYYEEWTDENVKEYKNTFNLLGIHRVDEIKDDVLILSESEENYWLFWFHKSGRSLIGKLDKTYSREFLKKSLITFVTTDVDIKNDINQSGNYLELLNKNK